MEPWSAKLSEGDSRAAWDLFIARYRGLLLATIRHLTRGPDDAMDVFAHVCEALGANDLARLRRYADAPRAPGRASFSTWLVVVVRNLTIDWLRQRDGRHRPAAPPPALTPLQQRIFAHEVLEGRPRIEAYELIRGGGTTDMQFGAFLKEVRATYRALDAAGWHGEAADPDDASPLTDDVAEADGMDPLAAHAGDQVGDALGTLTPDERLAVQLFVVDELPASEVARAVGWRNAKAVYNGVYRALAAIRAGLERRGLGRDDL